jgi:NhaP-type Na+/H+ or K+/H+ antiporter
LFGSRLSWREWATAAWFGPKGFASVFLALLALETGIPRADQIFHLAAIVIAASIVLHSSTDILVARWFRQADQGLPTSYR